MMKRAFFALVPLLVASALYGCQGDVARRSSGDAVATRSVALTVGAPFDLTAAPDASASDSAPVVAFDGSAFVVAWAHYDYEGGPAVPTVRATRVSVSGEMLVPPTRVATPTMTLGALTIAAGPDNVLVAWGERTPNGGDFSHHDTVRAMRLRPNDLSTLDGPPTEAGLLLYTAPPPQSGPGGIVFASAGYSAGKYLIASTVEDFGYTYVVEPRVVAATGDVLEASGLIDTGLTTLGSMHVASGAAHWLVTYAGAQRFPISISRGAWLVDAETAASTYVSGVAVPDGCLSSPVMPGATCGWLGSTYDGARFYAFGTEEMVSVVPEANGSVAQTNVAPFAPIASFDGRALVLLLGSPESLAPAPTADTGQALRMRTDGSLVDDPTGFAIGVLGASAASDTAGHTLVVGHPAETPWYDPAPIRGVIIDDDSLPDGGTGGPLDAGADTGADASDGATIDDAGPPLDAGSDAEPYDAGEPVDAGADAGEPLDAGHHDDAGATDGGHHDDAGATGDGDAATADASDDASTPGDASSEAGEDGGDNGGDGGGGGCSVAPRAASNDWLAPALFGIVLGYGQRRKRAARSAE